MGVNGEDHFLNPIFRLRLATAALDGAVCTERYIPFPYCQVWDVISDLERELPRIVTTMRSCRVIASDGHTMQVLATSVLGFKAQFNVRLRNGCLLMQSRCIAIGAVADPHGQGTQLMVACWLWRPGKLRARAALSPLVGSRSRVLIQRLNRRMRLG